MAARLRSPGAGEAKGLAIVAEVKRASPSRGSLNAGLDPARLAVVYARAGADAVSVLTEESRFRGSLADLTAAREGLRRAGLATPLLRKDFTIDPYQLVEARVRGADAALLIAAILTDGEMDRLLREATDLGLTPLVEVHDEVELRRVLPLRPPMVGINNRNLADFSVDLDTTRRLRPLIPPGIVVVSESGIHTPEQMAELARWGVDAVLIGEALVTAPDPASRLAALRGVER
jgi:indole-3-glycerol phosphate synthase